jgi:hypothetical protein
LHQKNQPVSLWPFNPKKNNQKWKFSFKNDANRLHKEITITNVAKGHVLDTAGGQTGNNTPIMAWFDNHNYPNQRFTITVVGVIPKPVNEVGYQITTLNDFSDEGVYCIKNVNSGKSIGQFNDTNIVKQNGTDCGTNFQFKILQIDNTDQYRIQSMTGKGVLTATNLNKPAHGITLAPYNKNNHAQKWIFRYRISENKQNKEIQIINVAKGHILDIPGGNKNNNVPVIAWFINNNNPNQRFTIRLVDLVKLPSKTIGHVVKDSSEFFNEGIYCMKAVHSNKALGLSATPKNQQIYQIGTECLPRFTYRVIRVAPEGTFKLQNQSGRGVMTQKIERGKNSHPVILTWWHNLKIQKWKIDLYNHGGFKVSNYKTIDAMDVEGFNPNDGARLTTYLKFHGSPNQRFSFTLVKTLDG